MRNSTQNRDAPRNRQRYERVMEILLLVIVTPAVVYGFMSLNHLPV